MEESYKLLYSNYFAQGFSEGVAIKEWLGYNPRVQEA